MTTTSHDRYGALCTHDRVQLTCEQQHRAADLAEALGEVEAQDLATEEVL